MFIIAYFESKVNPLRENINVDFLQSLKIRKIFSGMLYIYTIPLLAHTHPIRNVYISIYAYHIGEARNENDYQLHL